MYPLTAAEIELIHAGIASSRAARAWRGWLAAERVLPAERLAVLGPWPTAGEVATAEDRFAAARAAVDAAPTGRYGPQLR